MIEKILIIEDDSDISQGVSFLLTREGYSVMCASSGEEGMAMLTDDTNLIILDVMLPGMSGFEVCEKIRTKSYVPILFLTSKISDADKVLGLTAGADDYLVKPFSYPELSARVGALLRRRYNYDSQIDKNTPKSEWITSGALRINTASNIVLRGDTPVKLTGVEHQLLVLLASNPSKMFSAKELYESVWEDDFKSADANTVMVHIKNLRRKIEADPQKPMFIQTIWGKGYRFANQD